MLLMEARLLFSAIFLTKVIAFAVLAIMSFIAGVLIQRERMKAFVREFVLRETIKETAVHGMPRLRPR